MAIVSNEFTTEKYFPVVGQTESSCEVQMDLSVGVPMTH